MNVNLNDLKAMLAEQSGIKSPTFSIERDRVTASKLCSVTGTTYRVSVPLVRYEAWRSGMHAQHAFDTYSPEQREFLISGSTPAEFEQLFGEEE